MNVDAIDVGALGAERAAPARKARAQPFRRVRRAALDPLAFAVFVAVTFFHAAIGGVELAIAGRSDRSRIFGRRLSRYLIAMGPLYVKIGQILATRSDLFPRAVIDELRTLQDDVPPMSPRALRAVLREGLPRAQHELFAELEPEPLASASIAQVHRARLIGGEWVAVKIVRRGVAERLESNLSLVSGVLAVVHVVVRPLRPANLPQRFREIRAMIASQTDMEQEAANQRAMAEAFEGHPYVSVPRLFPEYCSRSIVVMELIDGIPGKSPHLVRLERGALAQRLQDTIYTMLYLEGLCHADPHPGNLFFKSDGRIVLIDFGLVARLSEDERWALSAFFYACTRHEWRLAVNRLTAAFICDRGAIDERFEDYCRDMSAVLERHFAARDRRWSTFEFFRDGSAVLRKYGATYTTVFTKVELIFISCEGTANQIDPEINIWENARRFNDRFSPYMSAAVREVFDRDFARTIPGSIALAQQAKAHLVAPTHLDRYFLPSAYPLFIREAKGSHLIDVDGNDYVDLSCGYGPHLLGYASPVIADAVQERLRSGWINALGHSLEIELADLIVSAFPGAGAVVFSNSGTEAVLQAIRICRAYRRRDKVAKFEGHYHGFTDFGLMSAWFRYSGEPDRPKATVGCRGCDSASEADTVVLQYGLRESLATLAERAGELACVVVEPMPNGMADYDAGFLSELRATCSELDVPLVFDEVVSGFRVAFGGIQVLLRIQPDLTCLGKIIGGGLPCGAVVGRSELLDLVRTTTDPFTDYESRAFVGGTMSGNSLTCAAGVATLDHLRRHPEIYRDLDDKTDYLARALRAIAQRRQIPLQVSARLSIFAITFSFKSPRFLREKLASNFKANLGLSYYMRRHGVYLPELHTMMLSAAHTQQDLDRVCEAFDRSLGEMIGDGFFTF